MHIASFAGFHGISLERSRKSPFNFLARVVLKALVSLTGRHRLVPQLLTQRQTDTQTKYCNPRCACVHAEGWWWRGCVHIMATHYIYNYPQLVLISVVHPRSSHWMNTLLIPKALSSINQVECGKRHCNTIVPNSMLLCSSLQHPHIRSISNSGDVMHNTELSGAGLLNREYVCRCGGKEFDLLPQVST